jgi:hypothetical protein
VEAANHVVPIAMTTSEPIDPVMDLARISHQSNKPDRSLGRK